jgi:hypothetical protein
MASRKLHRRQRRKRTRQKRPSPAKESYTLGHLAAAHLLSNDISPEVVFAHGIDTPASPDIEGALIAAYLDPNSFIVFGDMPVSIRNRHKRGPLGGEASFRELLAKTNISSWEDAELTKTESEQGRKKRQSLGLPRAKNGVLQPSTVAAFPHEFYRRYYGS